MLTERQIIQRALDLLTDIYNSGTMLDDEEAEFHLLDREWYTYYARQGEAEEEDDPFS